jgi:CheY-like chemotaxis protein
MRDGVIKMSKCILIVDDEEDVRTIVKMGLEMATNWTAIAASSGQEALNIAISRQPDIILLDLMMPDWDGRFTLEKLKTNPLTRSIPVVIVTAKTQSSEQMRLDNLDVAAIISKPFRPLKLSEQIDEILHKSSQARLTQF